MKEQPKAAHIRPSWDEYFMNIVDVVSQRGTCDRGYSATVIVKDNRILTTGYVGSPSGVAHCDDVGHELQEVLKPDGTTSFHCIRTSHSEQNALIQAAKMGVALDGATLYTTMECCYICAKLIISAGIKRVVCQKRYHGAQRTREIFKEAGVKLEVLLDEEMQYANMSGKAKKVKKK